MIDRMRPEMSLNPDAHLRRFAPAAIAVSLHRQGLQNASAAPASLTRTDAGSSIAP